MGLPTPYCRPGPQYRPDRALFVGTARVDSPDETPLHPELPGLAVARDLASGDAALEVF